jgi:hypothetical protein
VYSREIGDQVLEFGVSGKLVMNVLVMYDRQTDSLWSQLLGKAIEGELEGTILEYFPARQTTWDDWSSQFPDTQALVKGYSGRRDPYLSYYNSSQAGVLGQTRQDDRLSTKEYVIGVADGEDAVAYPFSALMEQPVINDQVGELQILVVFDPSYETGVVFNRNVEGRSLTFSQVEERELIDDQTGTRWEGMTGRAISGELIGAKLEQVKSTNSFWFGWADYFPQTRVYIGGG